MELTNTFTVNLPVADAWSFLTDLERVAPCMPGAQLLGVEGEEYRGSVKIKAGPVSAGYTGVARFVERDEAARRAVIRAEGRDTGGQGNAAATVTAVLTEQGQATLVSVTTQLSLSGRVAQFGRGVIADVSGKLLGQFVQRLEAAVAQSGAAQPEGVDAFNVNGAAPAAASEVSGGSGTADAVEPLDLMDGMGGVLLRRALPAAGALAAVVALIALLASVLGRRRATPAGTLVINLMTAPASPEAVRQAEGNRP